VSIDASRHRSVFNPGEWGNKRVDVIGVGATGSKVALALARLGVRNLHVWDGDTVEAHNIANQVYGLADVGRPKVEAFAEAMDRATGSRPTTHGFWQGERPLGEVVFCLPDSMRVRREVYEALRVSTSTRLVIETRMGASHGQVFTYRPGDPESLRRYEASLFDDDDAQVEVSACGTAITVGPTGDALVGFAVWQFLRYAAGKEVSPGLAIGVEEPQLVLL